MSLNNYEDLNDMCLDALREIGNIGSGNAASALSCMLSRLVNIQVPKIRILDYNEVSDNFGGPETLMVGLLLSMNGEVNGMMMFLLHKDFAHMTINSLLGSDLQDFSEVGEMELSAIKEVGNIMAASYINAIASLTNLKINITVPDICIDMVGAILSVPAIHYANISDKIIFIENQFDAANESADVQHAQSHVLMIPDVESLNKIMDSLGIGL
ncbi:MAG: chemotaxis protein CheC [Clostridiales bacterium]|nr:chemotaxis protein CheC [Clostridiales bacterium]